MTVTRDPANGSPNAVLNSYQTVAPSSEYLDSGPQGSRRSAGGGVAVEGLGEFGVFWEGVLEGGFIAEDGERKVVQGLTGSDGLLAAD